MNGKKNLLITALVDNTSFQNWALQKNTADILYWEEWIQKNPDKKELLDKAKEIVLGVPFQKRFVDKDKVSSEWRKLKAKILANTIHLK